MVKETLVYMVHLDSYENSNEACSSTELLTVISGVDFRRAISTYLIMLELLPFEVMTL